MSDAQPPRVVSKAGQHDMNGSAESIAVRCRTSVALPLLVGRAEPIAAEIASFTGLHAEHIAVGVGDWRASESPLVRVHSECLTGDVFGSGRCDCGPQLREALSLMCDEGGIVLYLRQEGRGIGLYNKIDAYRIQDQGFDTYQANAMLQFGVDERSYDEAAQMLLALGVTRCQLLSNNPQKRAHLERSGVRVDRRRPTGVFETSLNARYLRTKVRGGHLLDLHVEDDSQPVVTTARGQGEATS